MSNVPELVLETMKSAEVRGFKLSCEETVGRLLAALAGAVPPGGRVLELGTGAGVGAAWLASGLGHRSDATVLTLERDPELAATARELPWPEWVEVRVADVEKELPELGRFDLIFADAEGGKWSGLDLTVAALRPSGMLVVDDMDLSRYQSTEHRESVTRVRDSILSDPRLVAVDLPVSSGIMVATKRHD
ncbi:class I SAM-dependent methyltransferase [Streptomyces sp. NPDC048428]|uniref:O-methyltransferase n=1 Tax=Streptomyces sp. NPDC048428 TaxID=3154503 RepID=UPI003415DC60